jgi:rod shape-determining protein MreD
MSGVAWTRARVAIVLLVAIVLQTTMLSGARVLGIGPDLMLVITIAGGLTGGPEQGAEIGFAAGLLADLFLQATPLGLTALTFCLVGFAVGTLQGSVLRSGWWLAPLAALAASAAGVLLFVGIGITVGQTQLTEAGPRRIFEIAGVVGAINLVLAVPVTRVVSWATTGSSGAALARQSQQDRAAVR